MQTYRLEKPAIRSLLGGLITGVQKMRGGCLCGAVRYEAAGEPQVVANCHCSMCRRHSGAAYLTYAGFSADKVAFTGRPSIYRSSPGATRGHCGICGSPLTFAFDNDPSLIWLTLGSFDNADALAPTEHWFTASKLAWLDLHDDLPRWEGLPE
jgi:hypothetical protein